MPATTSFTAKTVADSLRVVVNYAAMLVKDIPAEKFAHMPHPSMNHPAFCLGHLSMYPNRVFSLVGRDDLVVEKEGWGELFDAPAECVEQDGRYPNKDEIIAHFMERHKAVLDALPAVNESVLQQENPMDGRMKEMFPTVGSAVNFLASAHTMMHLGQISAWRRAVGLGPVM